MLLVYYLISLCSLVYGICPNIGRYGSKCKHFDYCNYTRGLVCYDGLCGRKECLSGWISDGSKCYKVSNTELNKSDAIEYCRKMRASLIQVLNESDFQWLQSFVDTYISSQHVWVDATADEINDFRWSNNQSVDSNFWCDGEPNAKRSNSRFIAENLVTYGHFSSHCFHDVPFDLESKALCVFDLENCPKSTCQCLPYQYWSTIDQKCVSKKSNAEACKNDTECDSEVGLICDIQNKKCICGASRSWNNEIKKCVKCPAGWFHQSKKCYKHFNGWYNKQSSAATECKNNYNSTLIEILNEDILFYATQIILASDQGINDVWTGATYENDENDYYWPRSNMRLNRTLMNGIWFDASKCIILKKTSTGIILDYQNCGHNGNAICEINELE